jgi:peptidoglycan/LPS O-acetylase OafA/YrhL
MPVSRGAGLCQADQPVLFAPADGNHFPEISVAPALAGVAFMAIRWRENNQDGSRGGLPRRAANEPGGASAAGLLGQLDLLEGSTAAPPAMPMRETSGPEVARALDHQRIPVLDGVRGVAILLVVLCHGVRPPPGTHRLLSAIGTWGVTGVDLFFVLSGFLITGILYDAKYRPHYFRNFYARRVLRIFPLYYAFLFLALVIIPMLGGAATAFLGSMHSGQTTWTYWVYLSNFTLGKAANRGPAAWLDTTWSLAIEEQFYIVWPLIVLPLGRRWMMLMCGLVISAAFVMRVIFAQTGADWMIVYTNPFCRMDALAIGGLIALAVRDPAGIVIVRRLAWPTMFVAVLGLLYIFHRQDWRMWTAGFGLVTGYTAVAMLYASLLAVLITRPCHLLRGVLGSAVLRMFGRYSYAIYLFHLPVFLILTTEFKHDALYYFAPTGVPMVVKVGEYVGLGLMISLGLAVISWNVLESRCMALKRYFRDEPSSAHDLGGGAVEPGGANASISSVV